MTDSTTFIDTNVLIYHLVQTNHEASQASHELLARLRIGSETAFVSSTVVFETIHVSQTAYGVPNHLIADTLTEVLQLVGLQSDHKRALLDALAFWRDQGPLSFPDCFHLALAKQLGMTRIYSFDRKMNRYPGVERIEP